MHDITRSFVRAREYRLVHRSRGGCGSLGSGSYVTPGTAPRKPMSQHRSLAGSLLLFGTPRTLLHNLSSLVSVSLVDCCSCDLTLVVVQAVVVNYILVFVVQHGCVTLFLSANVLVDR